MKPRLILFAIGVSILAPLSKCLADTQGGFSVMPFYSSVTLESGDQEKIIPITFGNNSDSQATFSLDAMDFGQADESGGISFFNLPEDYVRRFGLASWMRLDRDIVALGPGETQVVNVTVENRDNLPSGGHYGAIVAKMQENAPLDDSGPNISLEPSFASLIFLKKEGGERNGLALDDFEIRRMGSGEVESVQLRFHNTGNTHVIPRGTVRFLDPLGRVISQGVINRESAYCMPETFRSFALRLENEQDAYFPGKYTVAIKYRYEGKEEFEYRQTSVFFFPKNAIIILVAALALLGISMWLWLRSRKRKRNHRQHAESGMQDQIIRKKIV